MAVPREPEGIHCASARFYRALIHVLNGDASAMDECWAHSDDTMVVDLLGCQHAGWDRVREYWHTLAEQASCGRLRVGMLHATEGERLGYTVSTEHTRVLLQRHVVRFSVRATNIYCRDNDVWRLVHRHTDTVPLVQELLRASSHRPAQVARTVLSA